MTVPSDEIQEVLKRIADLEAEVHREAGRLADLEPNATRRAGIIHQSWETRRAIHKAVVKVKEWDERRGNE